MDHQTRVWNALHFLPVDRVPFDLFDTAGYLFDGDRYDPAQRLRLSLEDQVKARLRSHDEYDTDLMVDTPVLAEGCVPYQMRLLPPYSQRYDLLFGVFPVLGGVWHPWPPRLQPRPGVTLGDDPQVDLVVEWENGLVCNLALETETGTLAGYEILMGDRSEWSSWQDALAPRLERFDYRYLDQVIAATHGDIALYGTILGPYSTLANVFGFQRSTFLFYDEPAFARSAMDWLTDVTIAAGTDMIRHGMRILRVGEATASLLSPAFYREFVLEHHARMNRALREAGGVPIMHICGRSDALLEAVAQADVPALETLTPPPLGNVELAAAKRRIGDRVCLKGNLDPVHPVAVGTPAEVAATTRHCLEVGAPGGGYILSVADDVVRGTPRGNLAAIAETVHAYYPA